MNSGQDDALSPWEALDLDRQPDNEKQLAYKLQTARNFKAVFASEQGEWVLNYLNGLFLGKEIVSVTDSDILVAASIRQGQANAIKTIHQILSYSEGSE